MGNHLFTLIHGPINRKPDVTVIYQVHSDALQRVLLKRRLQACVAMILIILVSNE